MNLKIKRYVGKAKRTLGQIVSNEIRLGLQEGMDGWTAKVLAKQINKLKLYKRVVTEKEVTDSVKTNRGILRIYKGKIKCHIKQVI